MMGNFVSKPPFDLTEFLSKPGSPKSNRNRRFGKADFRPRPAEDTVAEDTVGEDTEAVVEAGVDVAGEAGAEETESVEDGKS